MHSETESAGKETIAQPQHPHYHLSYIIYTACAVRLLMLRWFRKPKEPARQPDRHGRKPYHAQEPQYHEHIMNDVAGMMLIGETT